MDSTSALVNTLRTVSYEKQFECVADMYSNGFLDDKAINSMIDNGICIEHLAHLPLKTEQLLMLLKKDQRLCAEAAFTIIDRALTPQLSCQDFCDLFYQCCNESVFEHLYTIILFKKPIDDNLKDKYISAIKYVLTCNNISYDTKSKAHELEIYLRLVDTMDIPYIRQCFSYNNNIFYLAISQNCHTPDDILSKLILINNVKYSKHIRINANLILQQHRKLK